MRIHWATDIHLDHYRGDVRTWAASLPHENGDALLITGDISSFNRLSLDLRAVFEGYPGRVYFVLGNHCAYGGGIERSRVVAEQDASESDRGFYLTKSPPLVVGYAEIVGHDGWYDARNGDPFGTTFLLNDFFLIDEYARLMPPPERPWPRSIDDLPSRDRIVWMSQRLADRAATEAEARLEAAASSSAHVIFATHVPPYAGAAWHLGKPSDDAALPWFSSRVMGQAIDRVALRHLDVDFLVLCGHSHSEGVYQALPNVEVRTGRATYGQPAVWQTIDTETVWR